MTKANILLIEGRNAGRHSLAASLIKDSLDVQVFHTTKDALNWLSGEDNDTDLVVLDASSMRSSGVRSSHQLRQAVGDVPLILTGEAGSTTNPSSDADVYLVQPFTGRKLLNRVRRLLPSDDHKEEIIRSGSLTVYLSRRTVDRAGQGEKRLTPKLAALLCEFLRHPNEVLSRTYLMKTVWETNYFGDTRTLDVHIRWVRELIELNPARPKLLKTVRGVGYVFRVPPPEASKSELSK